MAAARADATVVRCNVCSATTRSTSPEGRERADDRRSGFACCSEARALGSVQLGLSGGEPLVRDDVEAIADEAHRLGYYTNLDHFRCGTERERLSELKRVGLDHIQLSFQDSTGR